LARTASFHILPNSLIIILSTLIELLTALLNKQQQNIIIPVVFYACETWSLTMREEHRLRVFENSVLREYLDQEGGSNRRLRKVA
jgi:hypothetical protein